MFTKVFWVDAFERAVKTFAQSILALAGGDKIGDLDLDWGDVIGVSGLAAALSVLTSIVSSSRSGTVSPASAVKE